MLQPPPLAPGALPDGITKPVADQTLRLYLSPSGPCIEDIAEALELPVRTIAQILNSPYGLEICALIKRLNQRRARILASEHLRRALNATAELATSARSEETRRLAAASLLRLTPFTPPTPREPRAQARERTSPGSAATRPPAPPKDAPAPAPQPARPAPSPRAMALDSAASAVLLALEHLGDAHEAGVIPPGEWEQDQAQQPGHEPPEQHEAVSPDQEPGAAADPGLNAGALTTDQRLRAGTGPEATPRRHHPGLPPLPPGLLKSPGPKMAAPEAPSPRARGSPRPP